MGGLLVDESGKTLGVTMENASICNKAPVDGEGKADPWTN
jgi:hypothetical protein